MIQRKYTVREDAGHSSGAITDLYIDVELKARQALSHELCNTPERYSLLFNTNLILEPYNC